MLDREPADIKSNGMSLVELCIVFLHQSQRGQSAPPDRVELSNSAEALGGELTIGL